MARSTGGVRPWHEASAHVWSCVGVCRGTSLIINCNLLGPYSSICLGFYEGPRAFFFFLWARYLCTAMRVLVWAETAGMCLTASGERRVVRAVQGYLTDMKTHPPRTLQ